MNARASLAISRTRQLVVASLVVSLLGFTVLSGCATPKHSPTLKDADGRKEGSPTNGTSSVAYVTGGQLEIRAEAHLLIQLNSSLAVQVTGDVVVAFFDERGHHGLDDPCKVDGNPHQVLASSDLSWSASNLTSGLWRVAAIGEGAIRFGQSESPAIEPSGSANGTTQYDRVEFEVTNWTLSPGLVGPRWDGAVNLGSRPWTANATQNSEWRPDAYLITYDFETGTPVGQALFQLRDGQTSLRCFLDSWSVSPGATQRQQGFQMQASATWRTGEVHASVSTGSPANEPELSITIYAIHISGVVPQPH